MSQKPEVEFGGRFLAEALPLVASYFSGEQVALAGSAVDLGEDTDAESQLFASQIRLRHALTCCAELIPLVHRIEERASSVSRTVRTETKGVIRGRLDIPRYVARRSVALSWPKSYPVLVSEESPATPENSLTARVLRHLLTRLNGTIPPTKTAEAVATHRYRHWISNRLRRTPWCAVPATSSMLRLQMETGRRIARRQTGNERAYSDLLLLIDDWRLTGADVGGATGSDRFVRALLSFPADDSFLDRIYEIWCIREIALCLSNLGANLLEGPLPLTENRLRPIYTFQLGNNHIEIWFQRSLDSGSAVWSYEITGKTLRGIPDITVIANGYHCLLVDAKHRLVTGNTRSEETYKMLGYFENFSPILRESSMWGVLVFVSFNGFFQSLQSLPGRRLVMLSADPKSHVDCRFQLHFTNLLRGWLNALQTPYL